MPVLVYPGSYLRNSSDDHRLSHLSHPNPSAKFARAVKEHGMLWRRVSLTGFTILSVSDTLRLIL